MNRDRTTIQIIRREQYADMAAANTIAQIGATTASFWARAGLHALASSGATSPPVVDQSYPLLPAQRDANYDNVLALRNAKGIVIFKDAKINVTKTNTIKETAMVSRMGSVKELIQAQDYQIDISGNIYTYSQNGFPYQESKELNDILSSDSSIEVGNKFLQEVYGISRVVMRSCDFLQQATKYVNALPFTLKLVSDTDYDFLVEEG